MNIINTSQNKGATKHWMEMALVLYPGSGAETFKMAYNSTSTIAALKTITLRLLTLSDTSIGTGWHKSIAIEKYNSLKKLVE